MGWSFLIFWISLKHRCLFCDNMKTIKKWVCLNDGGPWSFNWGGPFWKSVGFNQLSPAPFILSIFQLLLNSLYSYNSNHIFSIKFHEINLHSILIQSQYYFNGIKIDVSFYIYIYIFMQLEGFGLNSFKVFYKFIYFYKIFNFIKK